MIASIQGRVIYKGQDFVVISISGIGFQVYATHEIVDRVQIGEMCALFIQMIVREESITLFGFGDEQEKVYFNLLLGVSGIGPRLALSILSTLPIESINRAVLSEQPETFNRVPGIGKKNAQKIIIHLQGKITAASGENLITSGVKEADIEVLDALTALGYSIIEAQTAIQMIPRETEKSVEARLLAALKYFS